MLPKLLRSFFTWYGEIVRKPLLKFIHLYWVISKLFYLTPQISRWSHSLSTWPQSTEKPTSGTPIGPSTMSEPQSEPDRTEMNSTEIRRVELSPFVLFISPFPDRKSLLLPHRSSAVGLTSPFWSFGVRSTRGHVACSLGINCSTRSYFWIRRNAQLTFPNAN